MVESSEAAIKSIELQLVRVETCGKAPRPQALDHGFLIDSTEHRFEEREMQRQGQPPASYRARGEQVTGLMAEGRGVAVF